MKKVDWILNLVSAYIGGNVSNFPSKGTMSPKIKLTLNTLICWGSLGSIDITVQLKRALWNQRVVAKVAYIDFLLAVSIMNTEPISERLEYLDFADDIYVHCPVSTVSESVS